MPNPVEGLVEVYEHMVEVLLVLVIILKDDFGPQGWPVSCLPDLVADCRESDDYVLSLAWTGSSGMLSAPADFPFFNDCTAASTSLRRIGWSPVCVCLGTVQY